MSGVLRMRITILTVFLLCFPPVYAKSTDTLTRSDSLAIGQTLISASGTFELGFFQKGTSTKYYIGIWYKDIPSDVIVWVANRDSPSYSHTTTLKFGNGSNIVLSDGESHIMWQTNQTSGVNPVLQLLDTGNLVIREAGDLNPDNFIWQSFDHPTDTYLPGQKLGPNLKKGLSRHLASWVGPDEPGTGNFTTSVNYKGGQEIYLRNIDHQILYRSGPFDGKRFSGVPEMKYSDLGYYFTFHSSPEEVYYMNVVLPNKNVKLRSLVTFDGLIENYIWVSDTNQWIKFWHSRQDQCENYGLCGPNGVCDPGALIVCKCPRGFKPKNSDIWGLRDWSDGCVREKKMDCESDRFLALDNMKLPDTSSAFVDKTLSLDQCRDMCKKNCSCTAYANSELVKDFGPHCLIWTSNLIDMRTFATNGVRVYIRISASDLGSSTPNGSAKEKNVAMGIGICIAATIILVGLTTLIIWKRRSSKHIQTGSELDPRDRCSMTQRSQEIGLDGQIITSNVSYSKEAMNVDDMELPIFDFDSMAAATDDFSESNKLGQGGFGRVYKGVMLDGQEVAVKRLSTESGQGSKEFKNEVGLIAKLQHRNLVRLLGCCVHMNEKMLIYEYLENRSLDSILFNERRNSVLNWQTRFNIICGVARGLLYLHQDSPYRIIHRDLKASNILLDVDMNPKISDFGMARIFGGDETQGNTMRVVGTYGYMAPEFAMEGVFSIKSDVFSFGVLVLEILCGTKNRGFFADNELNLLGYAWEQWNEGKGTELLDKSMGDIKAIEEALRCLQIGLLCVQEMPEDRSTMGSVVLMLSSESTSLPQPKLPGFRMGWSPNEIDSSSDKQDQSVTVNQVTVTVIEPR